VKIGLLSWLPEAPATEKAMDVDKTLTPDPTAVPSEPTPETELYLRLLILHRLLTSASTYGKAMDLVRETVENMQAWNRRSMDAIAAKVWHAVERAYELAGEPADARPYVLAKDFAVIVNNV
jgi:26S proteasome regulatory subunit N3